MCWIVFAYLNIAFLAEFKISVTSSRHFHAWITPLTILIRFHTRHTTTRPSTTTAPLEVRRNGGRLTARLRFVFGGQLSNNKNEWMMWCNGAKRDCTPNTRCTFWYMREVTRPTNVSKHTYGVGNFFYRRAALKTYNKAEIFLRTYESRRDWKLSCR